MSDRIWTLDQTGASSVTGQSVGPVILYQEDERGKKLAWQKVLRGDQPIGLKSKNPDSTSICDKEKTIKIAKADQSNMTLMLKPIGMTADRHLKLFNQSQQ